MRGSRRFFSRENQVFLVGFSSSPEISVQIQKPTNYWSINISKDLHFFDIVGETSCIKKMIRGRNIQYASKKYISVKLVFIKF